MKSDIVISKVKGRVLLVFAATLSFVCNAQIIDESDLQKITHVKKVYSSSIYKKLSINSYRFMFNDKKTVAEGIIFFNDSTNKSVALHFKKPIDNEPWILPREKNMSLCEFKKVWNRKVCNVVVNLDW